MNLTPLATRCNLPRRQNISPALANYIIKIISDIVFIHRERKQEKKHNSHVKFKANSTKTWGIFIQDHTLMGLRERPRALYPTVMGPVIVRSCTTQASDSSTTHKPAQPIRSPRHASLGNRLKLCHRDQCSRVPSA